MPRTTYIQHPDGRWKYTEYENDKKSFEMKSSDRRKYYDDLGRLVFVIDMRFGTYRSFEYDGHGEKICTGNNYRSLTGNIITPKKGKRNRIGSPKKNKTKLKKGQPRYKRIKELSIADTNAITITNKELQRIHRILGTEEAREISYKHIYGVTVKVVSDRYDVFKKYGTVCPKCGLKASFYGIEKHWTEKEKTPYHLNLYGIDKDGNEILFTKDHIIPKAKGGKNNIDNYQTMCEPCNVAKGNTI